MHPLPHVARQIVQTVRIVGIAGHRQVGQQVDPVEETDGRRGRIEAIERIAAQQKVGISRLDHIATETENPVIGRHLGAEIGHSHYIRGGRIVRRGLIPFIERGGDFGTVVHGQSIAQEFSGQRFALLVSQIAQRPAGTGDGDRVPAVGVIRGGLAVASLVRVDADLNGQPVAKLDRTVPTHAGHRMRGVVHGVTYDSERAIHKFDLSGGRRRKHHDRPVVCPDARFAQFIRIHVDVTGIAVYVDVMAASVVEIGECVVEKCDEVVVANLESADPKVVFRSPDFASHVHLGQIQAKRLSGGDAGHDRGDRHDRTEVSDHEDFR